MRRSLLAGLVLAAVPVAGLAQTGPYLATVTDPEAKLRAGPSDKYDETATLPKGATLLVDHEADNGWLAVQDAPGSGYSVSWVRATFIDFDKTRPLPQRVVVSKAASLMAGQMGLAQPLSVRAVEVPEGTILRVIGNSVLFEGKIWHPVEPPAGDFRYVPKQAVKYDRPTTTTFSVRDSVPDSGGQRTSPAVIPASGTGGPVPTSPGSPAAGKPTVSHPLWAQAETAERDGRLDDAEKLYFQLARVMNEPGGDHDVANLCYTRIHSLREKKRAGTATAVSAGGSSTDPRPPIGAPVRPAGTSGPGNAPATPPDARDERAKWTGVGRLVRSALVLDGRDTYALESDPGITVLYVVAGPGVDLKRYQNKKVDVYGVSYNRRDLKKPYVVAAAVEPAQ